MERGQFRYSPELWPNAELPVPRLAIPGSMELDDEGWLIEGDGSTWVTAPAEMHLRQIRDVDVRDPGDLRRLCAEVGPMLDSANPWVGATNPRAIASIAKGMHQLTVANIARQLGLPVPDWEGRPPFATHVSEVATRVVLLRRLVEHVDDALAQRPTAPGWQAIGYLDVAAEDHLFTFPGERPLSEEDPEALSWYFFATMLNEGLARVSPRIVPPDLESAPYMGDLVDAYTAGCVMVFNDLHDDIPYRRCADETCGRIFRRQIGRSAGAFSRSEGVAYCSPQHARSQSQRERRRRARAQRAQRERRTDG